MTWYMFVALGIGINAFADILRRKLLTGTKSLDYYTTAFLLAFATTIAVGVYVLIRGFSMPPLQEVWVIFAINSIIYYGSWLASQRALQLVGVSEYSVLLTSRQIITWIASLVFLSVGLTLTQGLGSLIIIAGLVVIFFNVSDFKKHSKMGLAFTGLTAFLYGISILFDQILYRQSDPASLLFVNFIVTTLLIVLFRPKVIRSAKHLATKKRGPGFFAYGSLVAVGLVCMFTGLKLINNAPLVGALFQLQTIIAVLFSMIILGERQHIARKITGAVLASIGAALVVAT